MVSPVVLVTGCTKGGIGYSLCKQFSKHGCKVFATDYGTVENMSGLEDFNCEKLVLDVNSTDSVQKCFEDVIKSAGRIDIVVNNAGVPAVGALLDIDYNTAKHCINTNVFGVLSVSRVFGRYMAVEQRSGKIVNFGSVTGYASTPWAGVYSFSKAAVHSLSDTLRMELKPFGVDVTVVVPGGITSNFGKTGAKAINIPENSIYKSVSNFIYGRAELSQGSSSTSADEFSHKVVEKILRQTPPRYITEGSHTLPFYLFYYLPFYVKDYFFSKKFGVNQIKLVKDN